MAGYFFRNTDYIKTNYINVRSDYSMRKVLLILVVLLAVPLLVYYNRISVQQQFENPASPALLMPGANYILQKEPKIYSEISLQNIPGGTEVSIIELKNDWAMIALNGQKGWIPKWYLIEKNSNMYLKKISSDYMVIKINCQGLLYPNGPSLLELAQGNLVLPLLHWNEWTKVSIMQFSIPGISEIWVKEKVLATVSEIEPNQGYLRSGSQAYNVLDYNEIFSVLPEEISYSMPVSIEDKHGYFTYVSAPVFGK